MHTKQTNGLFQGQRTKTVGPILRICQFNIENISRSKSDCLSKLLLDNDIDILLIQETHTADETQLQLRGKIAGFRLIGATYHPCYGTATYARTNIDNVELVSTSDNEDIHNITIKVGDLTIINVYKPPAAPWPANQPPPVTHPTLIAGDFNSHHTDWKYRQNNSNGLKIVEWAETQNMHLIYSHKDTATFKSGRWGSETNPDLCFVSTDSRAKPIPVNRSIVKHFPHSQHRPIFLEAGVQIPVILTSQLPRWNFSKADWSSFAKVLDSNIRFIPPHPRNYQKFVNTVIKTAKKYIPRGIRKQYIPGWTEASERLYEDFVESGRSEVADDLLHSLDEARKTKWRNTTEKLNFRHSSRKAWSLLKKLGANSHVPQTKPSVTPDQIANNIAKKSRAPANKEFSRKIKKDLKLLKKESREQQDLSKPFTTTETIRALQELKNGKAPGFDNLHPEFLTHCGRKTTEWLRIFYSYILQSRILPKEFKRAKIIAILKPGKPENTPESYRPIAVLSVAYKLFERLLYNRLSPIIMESIPIDQAGFRPNRNCEDQVLALTTFIERGYEKRMKTGAVFVDLTAAYDTVWREGLTYKFLMATRCKAMTSLLDNMLSNRVLQISMGGALSKSKLLNNGLPQGSVLAPLLFNLYVADLPTTTSRRFMYADDIALASQHTNMTALEQTLSQDLEMLAEYFKKWRLTPSILKTETSCFHLNNRLAGTPLQVFLNGDVLPYNSHPKYLGVTLDRTLSYNKHLSNLAAKLKSRNNILYKLAGTSWGADAETLRTTSLSLVYSTAEYCSSVWLNSPHVGKVDVVLNQTMRIISGAIKTTPLYWLPVLSNIEPPEIRRRNILIREFKKISSNPALPIHQDLIEFRRLKSRNPPVKTAQQLISQNYDGAETWRTNWRNKVDPKSYPLLETPNPPAGFHLPRKTWVALTRIRTGHGRCGASLYKWNMRRDPGCDCGAQEQTIHHIINDCPLRKFTGTDDDFLRVTPKAVEWLRNLSVEL